MNRKISKLSGASTWCLLIGFISFVLFIVSTSKNVFSFMTMDGEQILITVLLFLPLPSYLLGIVFASIARDLMREADKKSYNKPDGRIMLGVLLLFGHIIVILMTYSLLQGAWESSRRASCLNNVRSLVQIAHMYAAEYDGEFPDGFKTLAGAGYTIGNLTSCPTAGGRADYGLNSAATMDCPPDTPLVGDFDSSNHSGRGGNIGYVDGRTRWHEGSYSAGSGPLENVSPEDWVRE